MAEHHARVHWQHHSGDFSAGSYSRAHTWGFDGGVVVPASPAPSVVKPPLSDPSAVDPEEAYVAAIASCHMLTFLHLASQAGLEVRSYEDDAVGVLTRAEPRRYWVSRVTLRPRVTYGAARPTPEVEADLHHRAHEECFIAQSVKTEILVEPAPVHAEP